MSAEDIAAIFQLFIALLFSDIGFRSKEELPTHDQGREHLRQR